MLKSYDSPVIYKGRHWDYGAPDKQEARKWMEIVELEN